MPSNAPTVQDSNTQSAAKIKCQQYTETLALPWPVTPTTDDLTESRDQRTSGTSQSSIRMSRCGHNDDGQSNPESGEKTEDHRHCNMADLETKRTNRSNQHNKEAEEKDENRERERRDPSLVDWDGEDDLANPQNWAPSKKWTVAYAYGGLTVVVTFASSVFSAASKVTAQEFGVQIETTTLGTSLFVLGFACGPIFWGPLSQLYGRQKPLFTGYLIFSILLVPVAVGKEIWLIMVCRFLGGFFASSPLAISGGAMADMFDPVDRGVAVSMTNAAGFFGPSLGPIIGGFITMSHLGWRWTQWINLIMAGVIGIIAIVVIPESWPATILHQKAMKLRYETRNSTLHTKTNEAKPTLHGLVKQYLFRPFQMLIREPILILIAAYLSLCYGITYGCFGAFPVAFQDERGWNQGVGSLPFLSSLIGVLFGSVICAVATKTRFKRKLNTVGLVPEERLIPMFLGCALLPAGLFGFAWTSSASLNPWPQIVSCGLIGAGIIVIQIQGTNYIIDVYNVNANCAIAGSVFLRSWLGASFPLFVRPMYYNLGLPWASSLLGFVSIALCPFPFLFYIFGSEIRKMSKFTVN